MDGGLVHFEGGVCALAGTVEWDDGGLGEPVWISGACLESLSSLSGFLCVSHTSTHGKEGEDGDYARGTGATRNSGLVAFTSFCDSVFHYQGVCAVRTFLHRMRSFVRDFGWIAPDDAVVTGAGFFALVFRQARFL